jgi:hypothetical protein
LPSASTWISTCRAGTIAFSSLRLGGGRLERAFELVGLANRAHALAASARDCLEQHRITRFVSGRARLVELRGALGSRHDRDSSGNHLLLRCRLVAHARHRLGRRPDEDELVVETGCGECGVLREEAVAGVDRLAARRRRGSDHRRDAEIALVRRSGPNADGAVGEPRMQRALVRGRVDRHGFDAELVQGANHADRDLASIGDQDAVEH